MDLALYLRAIAALLFVIALMGCLLWLLRRYGLNGRLGKIGICRRLSMIESMPVDGRRRLILVRRDDTEHLLLVGGSNDLLIETTPPPFPNGKDIA